ncbi:MAG: 1-phosphofructokinase family hexose kinase [Dictyoglomus sp.]
MILIVNINPSLDIIFNVHSFHQNKVNRSYKEYITPGGKGINVAKTLKAFEENVKIIGFCGGSTGKILKEELRDRKIDYDFIETQGMTRFAIGINNSSKNSFTVLNGAGSKIEEEKWKEFFKLYKENYKEAEIVILSGSLPPEASTDIYYKLLKEIKGLPILKVVDARDKALLEALKERPDIVKPNKEEIENIINKKLKRKKDMVEAIKFLINFGVKYPIISLGKKGAIINVNHNIFHAFTPPASGIQWGTGDAFLAGFIVGLKRYQDPLEAIKLACATGYIKTKHVEITRENIDEIFLLKDDVAVQKIS